VFGREFADHTAKDLLSLPTSRTTIVVAKFAVVVLWCLALTAVLAVAGVVIGVVLAIPGTTAASVAGGLLRVAVTALLSIALTTVFGLAASIGRGYLPAIGTMFVAVFTAQLVAAFGYGGWYPFSVPALHAGLTGDPPTGFGYAAVVTVAVVSIWATARWWRRTDHNR
jgi:ABC-2 type transport system permease protein